MKVQFGAWSACISENVIHNKQVVLFSNPLAGSQVAAGQRALDLICVDAYHQQGT